MMEDSLRQGLALLDQGAYEPAHQTAIALIRANPQDPVPYYLLARIALDHKNYQKAEELYGRAAKLGPNSPLYVAGQGQFFALIGRHSDALACADRSVSLGISDAFVADTVGVIYSRTGFHEKAVPLFEKAVELNPKPGNFHYNLGASLQFSGQFDRALGAYEAAIQRSPDDYRAHSSRVMLRRQTSDDNHLGTLKKLFSAQQKNADASLHLGHAIAKTLEDLDQHPASFEWLVKAKHRKRRALGYKFASDLAIFAAASRTAEQLRDAHPAGSTESPIFVIGLPRTGTTLVDRIISSHRDVKSAGELNTFAGLIKSESQTPSNLVLDAATLEAAAAMNLSSIGEDYMRQTLHLARGAKRFTDKMPLNFFYAALIHRALPNARIVALRRDPTDSCLSNYRQLFSTGYSYYNYSLNLINTADYYLAFDQLMSVWRASLPANRFYEVHYEAIVANQEDETRTLLEFCGLDWDDACLRFYENNAPVSTASSVQVRQPLYSGSIGRWKKYGDKIAALREHLGPIAHSSSDSNGT